MSKVREFFISLQDPSTKAGTAFYAALIVALYDAAVRGLSWTHGVVLLSLAGLDQVARIMSGGRNAGPPPESPA